MILSRPGRHPRRFFSARMFIGKAPSYALILGLLVLISSLGAIFSLSLRATGEGQGFLRLWLDSIPALLGVDVLPRSSDSAAQEALSAAAAFIGSIAPAVILGVVAVRLFSLKFLVWRSAISVFPASELSLDGINQTLNGKDAVLSVRLYKRIRNVQLLNVRVETHLRFFQDSPVDGTPYLRRRPISVLDQNGVEVQDRLWPIVSTALPLTVYIPTHGAYDGTHLSSVQDVSLERPGDYILYVTVTGRVAGLGVEFSDAHEYNLHTECQTGRPTPIDPEPGAREIEWRGWKGFEKPAAVGVFLYDDLVDPLVLKEFLGNSAIEGRDYIQWNLEGWQLTWTGNSGAGAPAPADGHQTLSLNIERREGAHVSGTLFFVNDQNIERLLERRRNHQRVVVTRQMLKGREVHGRDIVWTFVADSEDQRRATAAIAASTGVIDQSYLDRIAAAFQAHGSSNMADASMRTRIGIEIREGESSS